MSLTSMEVVVVSRNSRGNMFKLSPQKLMRRCKPGKLKRMKRKKKNPVIDIRPLEVVIKGGLLKMFL